MRYTKQPHKTRRLILASLHSIEVFLFFSLIFISYFFLVDSQVRAIVGEDNVTTVSFLQVGASEPIIDFLNISDPVSLSPNETILVSCAVGITNPAGDSEIQNVTAELFTVTDSFYGDSNDNNTHYTNSSCFINTSYGDGFEALANCSFFVYYNAQPGTWNCTANVTNNYFSVTQTNTTTVNELLAFLLPDTIDYGIVNATDVSLEHVVNVTNVGNVQVNLSLHGYAFNNETTGANYSMNCTLGSLGVIPIGYEKYNLTESTGGSLTLSEFENTYTNVTGTPLVRNFELNYHQTEGLNDAVNETYWRIYVPTGVAGNCSGTVVFGAVVAPGI